MRRRYYFLLIPVIVIIGIVVCLHLTGYLFNDQRIIPPSSPVDWKKLDGFNSMNQTAGSNITSYPYRVILNLTEQMKEIPGIENIKYEVFVSNDSMLEVVEYYTHILENDGYSYHDEYSGVMSYNSSNINYYTFTKGLNAVVVYVSEYNQLTWICYSTSDIIHYKEIFDYMVSHGILL